VELLQVFPFVLQGVVDWEGDDKAAADHRRLQAVFVNLEKFARMVFSYRVWRITDVQDLRKVCSDTIGAVKAAFGDEFNALRPTIHTLFHFADYIPVFGPPRNLDTAPYESLHVQIKRQAKRAANGPLRELSIMNRYSEELAMLAYIQMATQASDPVTRATLPLAWQTDAFKSLQERTTKEREPIETTDVREFNGFEDCLGEVMYYTGRKWQFQPNNGAWTGPALGLSDVHFQYVCENLASWVAFYGEHTEASIIEAYASRKSIPLFERPPPAADALKDATVAWFSEAHVLRQEDDRELFRVHGRYARMHKVCFVSYFDDRLAKTVVGMVDFFIRVSWKKESARPPYQFAAIRQMTELPREGSPFKYATPVHFASLDTDAFTIIPVSALCRCELVVPDFGSRIAPDTAAAIGADDAAFVPLTAETAEDVVAAVHFPVPLEVRSTGHKRKRCGAIIDMPAAAKATHVVQDALPTNYLLLYWVKRGLIV
jgi:hypothetical protein